MKLCMWVCVFVFFCIFIYDGKPFICLIYVDRVRDWSATRLIKTTSYSNPPGRPLSITRRGGVWPLGSYTVSCCSLWVSFIMGDIPWVIESSMNSVSIQKSIVPFLFHGAWQTIGAEKFIFSSQHPPTKQHTPISRHRQRIKQQAQTKRWSQPTNNKHLFMLTKHIL